MPENEEEAGCDDAVAGVEEPSPGDREENGIGPQHAAGDSSRAKITAVAPLDEDPGAAWRQRVPPQSQDAEMAVLGAMLVNVNAAAAVGDVLVGGPADFGSPSHSTIYSAMVAVDSKGDPIEALTVIAELERRHKLDAVGGKAYIHTLAEQVTAATSVRAYADLVRQASIRRQLTRAGHEIADLGYEGSEEADTLVDQAEAKVFAIAQGRRADDRADMADLVDAIAHQIAHPDDAPARPRTATGYPFIDSHRRVAAWAAATSPSSGRGRASARRRSPCASRERGEGGRPGPVPVA